MCVIRDDRPTRARRIAGQPFAEANPQRAHLLFVLPVVALLSFAFANPLALAFRPIELIAMGASAVFVGFVIRDGRSHRWEGALLIAVYVGFVLWFLSAGDR